MARVRLFPFVLLLIGCVSIGCGPSKPALYPVSGTVTLDGKPLAQGSIYFKTINTGVIESFEIENGQFAGEAQAGDRRVEVTSYVVKAKEANFGGMKGELKENIIPPRYNVESKLTASVAPDGPNQFKFDLVTK